MDEGQLGDSERKDLLYICRPLSKIGDSQNSLENTKFQRNSTNACLFQGLVKIIVKKHHVLNSLYFHYVIRVARYVVN